MYNICIIKWYNMANLNSNYKGRPAILWIVILISLGVAIWYFAQAAMYWSGTFEIPTSVQDVGEFGENLYKTLIASFSVFFGLLSLLVTYLIYKGSRGGRLFLLIILVLTLVFGLISILAGAYTVSVQFICAVISLIILFQPSVKAFFGV